MTAPLLKGLHIAGLCVPWALGYAGERFGPRIWGLPGTWIEKGGHRIQRWAALRIEAVLDCGVHPNHKASPVSPHGDAQARENRAVAELELLTLSEDHLLGLNAQLVLEDVHEVGPQVALIRLHKAIANEEKAPRTARRAAHIAALRRLYSIVQEAC